MHFFGIFDYNRSSEYMKKEVLIAIFLGLSLGLVVTYGIYTARRSLTASSLKPSPTPLHSTPSPSQSSLAISSPEDETIQSIKEARVVGTSTADSMIVVMVNNRPYVTNADSTGNFALPITLDPGSNVILTRSINEDGVAVEDERVVIYTTVSLDESPGASASASPSPSPKPTKKPSPSPKASPTP